VGGQLSLLDAFELRWDGQPIAMSLGPQRVLAYLALQGRPVQRLAVAGTLWADSSATHAAACLRTSLWRLKRTGRHLVNTTGTALAIAPGVVVDVRDFEQRVRNLRRRPLATATEFASVSSETAGGILPDWDDDWVIVERERFRQLRLHALEQSCVELARMGMFGDAIEAGLAALREEPLHETAHRVLIETYLAEGNRADALRQYAQYAEIMRADLQLEPSADVTALVAPLRAAPKVPQSTGERSK
jgi:DNA-binding SARP family transcriptional activator